MRTFLLFVFFTISEIAAGQDVDPAMKSLIESGNFIFKLQSVSPMKGGFIPQNPGYSVTMSKDTVDCFLPYFGRIYNPSYASSDSGLKFVSTRFEKETEARKKGGWNINLKFRDTKNVSKMMFTTFENGKTTISVICKDRETISYSGYIEKRK